MKKTHILLSVVAVVAIIITGYLIGRESSPGASPSASVVRLGVSPFQDTLVPIVGREKGWYADVGLDVKFSILGWTEVMEALSAGQIDVAVNNISSVIATHRQNPELIYWYGMNPFDNGFALMIRPDGPMKTVEEFESELGDHELAVQMAAAQLRGKTVITTSLTDMEQGVAAAARRGGLDFQADINIVDLNPDEGLAAFLSGEGDAYIGGIPHRTRAQREGMLEMLTGADLGPPPINGFVTTKEYARNNEAELLKLLNVWFKIVNHINVDMNDGAQIIVDELNSYTGAQFTLDDFRMFWNNYEHFPASPEEVENVILDPAGRNYWKARWDDSNTYFHAIKGSIEEPIAPEDAFWMLRAHEAYVEAYDPSAGL